jgi:hypothetical protein
MADKKISELTAITGSNTAATDVFVVVDTSTGQTKKITREELNNAIEQDVLSTVDINGGTIDGTTIGATTAAAGSFTTVDATGNITVGGTVDGRDVAADGTKLDGIEASATADQTGAQIATALNGETISSLTALTTTGAVIVGGDFTVNGTTTTINSTTLEVDDKNIVLASGAADAAAANGSGITIDGASATFTYVSTGDKWQLNKPLDVTGTVTADGLTVDGNAKVTFGSVNRYIQNPTGTELRIGADNSSGVITAYTNGSERLRIDSGSVGVGTSSLSNGVKTVIQGSQTGGAAATSGTTQTYGLLRLQGTTFTSALDMGTNGGNYAWIQSTDQANLGTNYSLALNPNGGNVGIGDTAPVTPLTIATTNKLGATFTGTTNGEGLTVTQTDYTSGNYISLVEAAHDDSGDVAPNVRIGAMFDGNGSNLAFGTSNSYGSGITNTAMTIDSSGNVGIGTSPNGKLHVKDQTDIAMSNDADGQLVIEGNGYAGAIALDSNGMHIYHNSTIRYISFGINETEEMRLETDGDLHVDGNVVAYSTTISDIRLKKDIAPIEDAVTKVQQLNGCTFTYLKDDRKSAGLIAQDLEKVLPSCVIENEAVFHGEEGETYKTVQYDQVIGLLVEAVKELKAEIEELKNGTAK